MRSAVSAVTSIGSDDMTAFQFVHANADELPDVCVETL